MTAAFPKKWLARLLAGRKPGHAGRPARRLTACVFKLDGIGDFVLSLGAIRQILAHYGEANCALIVGKPVIGLAQREFPQATVLGFKHYVGGMRSVLATWFQEAAQLGGLSFETLICLRYQRITLQHLVLSWISADRSIGFANTPVLRETDEKVYQFPLTELLPLPMQSPPGLCLELERHRQLAGHVTKLEIAAAAILPRFTSFHPAPGEDLIVTPYSSDPIKDYPEDQLSRVLQEVSRAAPIPIRLCGGPVEAARLRQLGSALRSQGLANVSMEIPHSLDEFAQRVAGAKAILTVDTSTAHLATAMDKPAVILLGGGVYGQWGPWQHSARQSWLSHPLPCFGCNWRCIYPEIRCLSEIPPASVAQAVLERLASC